MAVSLETQIRMKVDAILSSGVSGVSGTGLMGLLDDTVRLTSGTSTGQADRCYYAERTLVAAANETLDLAGVLEDLYGNVLTFVTVKLLVVKNLNTAAGSMEFGPNTASAGAGVAGTSPPWKAVANKNHVAINGGVLFMYNPAGWTVTATTADLLYAENLSGANAVTYRVLIIGTSA